MEIIRDVRLDLFERRGPTMLGRKLTLWGCILATTDLVRDVNLRAVGISCLILTIDQCFILCHLWVHVCIKLSLFFGLAIA